MRLLLFLPSLLGTRRSPMTNFFFRSLVTVPQVSAKVNSVQFLSRFQSATVNWLALDPIGLNHLEHLMKFTQRKTPYSFGFKALTGNG